MAKRKGNAAAKASAQAKLPKTIGKTYKGKGRADNFAIQPTGFSFEYTTPGPFCQVKRLKQGRCATQLGFVKGQPVVRLCDEGYGKPGTVIPVKDAEEAQRKANSFCATQGGGKALYPGELSFIEDEEPVRGPFVPHRTASSSNGSGSSKWLMFGLIGGIVGATILKRLTPAQATP